MRANPFVRSALGGGLLVVPFLLGSALPPSDGGLAADAKYIGVKQCKNCHNDAAKGDAYKHWEASAHAKAFETLASDAAKKIAAERKIEDPQKAPECLKCHTTAFGVDKKLLKKSFKPEGVQCEACHGPADDHQKARMKDAANTKPDVPATVGTDEIDSTNDPAKCLKCHNKESPTFKGFCFKEYMTKILHLDPRKKRTPEELKAIVGKCPSSCEKCAKEKEKEGEGK